ncbi:MAG: alpha/beta fold hydrolase [Burkholderiales bacterium]|nr:alpha/beta fold hydrolase [Burkholderiales bacterium]
MRVPTELHARLTRGLRLHALDWPGTAPAVVLIHPNRTINRVWDHVVAASTLPNRFVAPCLRGHGLSDYPAQGYRLADHRDDLIELVAALDAGPVFLVGQATGAMLALMIAHARPDLVRAVVAANPALAIPAAVNEMVRSQVQAQVRLADRAAARAALPFASRWSPEVVEHYLDHALEPADGGAAWRWRYHPQGVAECEADLVNDHSDAIRTALPVLVFGGAEATVLPPSTVDRVCALLPNHRREVLPAADHRLCQDNPAGFAALMDSFVGDHLPRAAPA